MLKRIILEINSKNLSVSSLVTVDESTDFRYNAGHTFEKSAAQLLDAVSVNLTAVTHERFWAVSHLLLYFYVRN
jgi:hypothetical protein